jgi:ketosteroid isomerase-like protein
MGEMEISQQQNKKLIQEGFDRWASNQGSFFDLLSDDIEWTITGTCPISKTYTSRKQFLDEAIAPLSARTKLLAADLTTKESETIFDQKDLGS